MATVVGYLIIIGLVGGIPTLVKNINQLGLLFPIYGKIENVPNHQPVVVCSGDQPSFDATISNMGMLKQEYFPVVTFWFQQSALTPWKMHQSMDLYIIFPIKHGHREVLDRVEISEIGDIQSEMYPVRKIHIILNTTLLAIYIYIYIYHMNTFVVSARISASP